MYEQFTSIHLFNDKNEMFNVIADILKRYRAKKIGAI